MSDIIRHIKPTDRITNLYAKCDQSGTDNVLAFTPPLSNKSLEIIDDVTALLENPDTRLVAEDILSEAIYQIASKFSPK